jgi:hypothetical protein
MCSFIEFVNGNSWLGSVHFLMSVSGTN